MRKYELKRGRKKFTIHAENKAVAEAILDSAIANRPNLVRVSPTRKRLQAAIRNLVLCEDADSWKGGGDPDEMPIIEARLKHAKKHLKKILDELEPCFQKLDRVKADPLKHRGEPY